VSEPIGDATVDEPPRPIAKITWLLPVLSIIWLVVKLWASRGQIHDSGGGTVALATAALALPGVVQAALVAGIGLALLASSGLIRSTAAWLRWVGCALAGAVIGGAAGAVVAVAYPHFPSITAIAITLAVAGLIGGILVAIPRIRPAMAGGLAASLASLVVITILNSNAVLSRLLNLYGAGTTAESVVHAGKLVQYTQFVLAGLVAGWFAYAYLRRAGVRLFPIYLLAGALPGLLLLIAYGVTTIGGHHLLNAANALSDADRIVNGLESSETVPNALIVLFVAAFTALIAFGRTLEPTKAPRRSAAINDKPKARPTR
jgi:hypothetical protein